ncbi:RNA polymerase sigma factor [Spirosoma flavum]|uniref:RNA polymerase sigma factor n=1 Tax=Spirosoma flavum TaxID=2048557 RepID=A0ABW6ADP4_9BACT
MSSFVQQEDETEQWQKLQHGEQDALAYFYEKYADWLLKYGLSVVYNRELIQDSVQELFIQIWNRRENLTVPQSVKYYLMVSLRRIILKDVTKSRLTTNVFPDDTVSLAHQHNLDLEEFDETVARKIQVAVRSLPPRQQEIIFLRFFDKLSYEEISEITGLDYQILRNTIHRAVKALRHALVHTIDFLLPFLLFLSI